MAEEKTPTQEQVALDWLRITVERFQKSIDKAGVVSHEDLFNSFVTELKRSNGTVTAALIKFKLHGRFVDIGVGRGVPVGSQRAKADFFKFRNKKGQLHHYGRKPKKWYSKTLAGQTKKLGELMAQHFGISTVQLMESLLKQNTIEIKI